MEKQPHTSDDERTNFIHPFGENKKEIYEIFNSAVKLVVETLASAGTRPLLPNDRNVPHHFPLPQQPAGSKVMQAELERIAALSLNAGNPNYIGHMDSMASTYSIIGSLVSAALNNNMFSLDMSPYFSRLERAITAGFSQLFGLPSTAGGVIVSGGTLSNIQAIIVARNTQLGTNDGDISKSQKKLVFFASQHAHISLQKAAMIGGLGAEACVRIGTDRNGRMDVDDLNAKIEKCIADGCIPFAVCATLGTTVTGNIDPIYDIAQVTRRFGLWLHADAIYGGAIILSRKEKHRLRGIELADSISFNPQKWLHVAKTCSLLLFRDHAAMQKHFSMKAFYTKSANDFVNISELNIQGTKHAEVLKLWLSLLSIGLNGYETMIDRAYEITRMFVARLSTVPDIEFASEQEMNIPTFRLRAHSNEASDQLNREYNTYVLEKYNVFFSLATFNGRLWQRTILLNPFIDERVIDTVYRSIVEFRAP
ncbi:MAG TPA: pyridoxal-dependent decarboxylase [Chryseosolibacter sp.]